MAIIKCPECNNDVSENAISCPNCGCPINDENTEKGNVKIKYCPECGQELEFGKTLCKNCGFDSFVANANTSSKNNISKICMITSCVAVIVAFVLFYNGYKQTHNDKYDFYKQHYEECMDGFAENKQSANSSGGYFKSTYNYISEEYKSMANDDKKKMDSYKRKGMTFYVVGCLFIAGGIIIVKKGGKMNGTN